MNTLLGSLLEGALAQILTKGLTYMNGLPLRVPCEVPSHMYQRVHTIAALSKSSMVDPPHVHTSFALRSASNQCRNGIERNALLGLYSVRLSLQVNSTL